MRAGSSRTDDKGSGVASKAASSYFETQTLTHEDVATGCCSCIWPSIGCNGASISAAMWLKIVHEFASPDLSPAQVMIKAYDDMPTVPRPAFLGEA